MASEQQNVPAPPAQRICPFTDASEHENCWPFLRSEGHVALVYKANNAACSFSAQLAAQAVCSQALAITLIVGP